MLNVKGPTAVDQKMRPDERHDVEAVGTPVGGGKATRLTGVALIDLAPTIYELAGIPIPSDVDGRSLIPLLRGTTEWRDALLLEGWPGTTNAQITPSDEEEEEEPEADQAGNHVVQNQATTPTDQDYQAIRTKDFVYVETVGDKPELYHVTTDPYQMHNLVDRPEFAELVKRFSDWLHHAKL